MFREPTDARVEAFSESAAFDRRLADDDIDGSIAHARMLASVGLMTVQETDAVAQALEEIRGEIQAGRFEFTAAKEDTHLHIENPLTARLGDTGRKLHTARSRNDQVATDLRLYCRRAIDRLDAGLAELQRAFLGMAEREWDLVIPGYTHLRRAHPVLAAHQLLSWCEKLHRDRDRLADCRRWTNTLPLGSGALAGTSLPIDREHVKQALGFEALVSNSLDAAAAADILARENSGFSVDASVRITLIDRDRRARGGGYGHATDGCCDANPSHKPRSHDTSRRKRPSSWRGWGRSFRSSARTVAATSSREKTAGRSRLTSNRRLASGRRPGWLRPREVRFSHTSANRSNRRQCRPPGAHPPTGANSCRSMTIATSFKPRRTSYP